MRHTLELTSLLYCDDLGQFHHPYNEISGSESFTRWLALSRALGKLSQALGTNLKGKFQFFGPHLLLVQKFKQVWLRKIVVGCPHHLQLESPLHIYLVCVSKRTSKSTVLWMLLSTSPRAIFSVVQVSHHLQLESPPYLPSLSSKWPS